VPSGMGTCLKVSELKNCAALKCTTVRGEKDLCVIVTWLTLGTGFVKAGEFLN